MIPTLSNSQRIIPSAAGKVASQRPESATRRRNEADDQMMYAWSMTTSRAVTRSESMDVRMAETCPPETYLG